MTGELMVRMESFHGIPVRIVQQKVVGMIPLNDIADGIGLDRSGLHKLLKRNNAILSPYIGMVNMSSPSGTQETICLSRDGVVGILMKTDFGKMKDPVKQAKVIDFQKWAIDILSKIIRGEPVQQVPVLETELSQAKHIAELTGTDLKAMQAAALRKCGLKEYADALQQQIPTTASTAHSQSGIWMIPQDIGNECGLNARQVNSWLYNHDFQYPDGSVWRLTAKGEAYGEEYLFVSPYKHSEIRIRWHRSILIACGLKRPMPESQTALAHG